MAFTHENTSGYTDHELDMLNAEWELTVFVEGLEIESDEYYQREKQFADEVSRQVV